MKDYYAILGVEKNASDDDIKKAFRKLAQKYHPDKKGGDEAKFKEMSEAYAVLSDKKRRAEYDTYGNSFSGGNAGAGFGGFDFSGFQGFQQDFDLGDIFGDMFGGGSRREKRGRDISIDLELSFKESVFGVERRVLVTKTNTCNACSGTGAEKGSGTEKCSGCNGVGHITETRSTVFGTFSASRECPRCSGRGTIPKDVCRTCRGAGVVREQTEISVAIPSGIHDGEMIRLPKMGEAIAGGTTGDLYVKIHVKPEPHFGRDGTTITTTLSVKLTDAILGALYTLKTLDGDMELAIPQGTSHGDILKVKGKGVPYGHGNRGDLAVRITLRMPQKLSRQAKKLIEELRQEGV
jgi:molecular chaperone DnaJ